MGDRRLKVTAHPSGHHDSTGVCDAQLSVHRGQPRERLVGVTSTRGNGHHPPQAQVGVCAELARKSGHLIGTHPAATRVRRRIQVDLEEDVERAPGPARSGIECTRQPVPVERVNHVGIPRNRCCFVALELTDEVDPWGPVPEPSRDVGDLGPGFLVAALTDEAATRGCRVFAVPASSTDEGMRTWPIIEQLPLTVGASSTADAARASGPEQRRTGPALARGG